MIEQLYNKWRGYLVGRVGDTDVEVGEGCDSEDVCGKNGQFVLFWPVNSFIVKLTGG